MNRRTSRGLLWAAALLAAGCAAAGRGLSVPELLGAEGTPFLDRVRALEGRTNPERRRALVAMLREKRIPFTRHMYLAEDDGGRKIRGENIILELGAGEKEIVLSAHYDAKIPGYNRHGTGPYDEDDVLPAANDNASCVSALLGAYEKLRGRALRHKVKFIFFDDEEKNLLGSRAYVRDHGVGRLAAVLNGELCGMGDGVGIWPVTGDVEASPVLARLEATLRRMKIEYSRVGQPPAFHSDHDAFREGGFRHAFTLTAGSVKEREAIIAYAMGEPLDPAEIPLMWKNYHTRNDTSEHLEESAMEMIADVAANFVLSLED